MKSVVLCLFIVLSHMLHAAPGVVVLAGGGPEGDIGVTTDWSYHLYKKLIENGDTTGDNKIKVVVLSLDKPDTNFMVDYLKSMGADSSVNLVINSKKAANNPKLVSTLADADVLFIRGGNQGKAYQLWKDTKLHDQIKALANRGGAVGGTSSGSMGLSEYSITGGQDFSSDEVLANSTSPLLNDSIDPKVSGIHNDFLNLVPGIIVDTHCGERGRIGRLLATHAKAVEDYGDKKLISVCLEEKTGIAVESGVARVYGTGTVHFLQETKETKVSRLPGKPLAYTNIRNDALTEGWSFDFNKNLPDLKMKPANAVSIKPNIFCGEAKNELLFKSKETDEINPFGPKETKDFFVASDAFSEARLKSGDKKKGVIQTLSLKKMYDSPNSSVVFIASGTQIKGSLNNDVFLNGSLIPAMVFDCQHCTHKGLSSYVSTQDDGSNQLHSPALVNMRIHIVNEDLKYNAKTHRVKFKKEELLEFYSNDCTKINGLFNNLPNFQKEEEQIIERIYCK